MLSVLLLSFIISSCSSSKHATTEYEPDKIVMRSDGKTERPSWALETKTVIDDANSFIIIGVAEVPGDSRTNAALKLSDSAARGNLAQKLETSVTKIVENTETGLSMADQGLKSLIREVSNSGFKNVDIGDRYYEKVIRTSSSGDQTMIMKVFSMIKITKSEFSKMAQAQVEKSKTASPDLKNKLESIIEKNLSNQFEQDM